MSNFGHFIYDGFNKENIKKRGNYAIFLENLCNRYG
jgi:hypothetical protein